MHLNKEAFGGFDPLNDADAAIKLVLDSIFASARLSALLRLAMDALGGIAGEPGWILERRDLDVVEHNDWPLGATFRAHVNPDAYRLQYPEFFCDNVTFVKYVNAILSVYAERIPGDATISELKRALGALSG